MNLKQVDIKQDDPPIMYANFQDTLIKGEIQCLRLSSDPEQVYFLYLPLNYNEDSAVFVSVHGISRNAKHHVQRNIRRAEKRNVIIVAPLFSEQRFPDYQRLGRLGYGLRADLKLLEILDEIKAMIHIKAQRYYLFGYSGGGQFVHRFAMAHPDKVAKMAIGAAGWYTPPNESRRFPHGLRTDSLLPDLKFDLQKILKIPACVVVGELDNEADEQLRQSAKVIQRQGENRIERGLNWIANMQEKALQYHQQTDYEFHLLQNAGHSYRQCMRDGKMGGIVFRFLFGRIG